MKSFFLIWQYYKLLENTAPVDVESSSSNQKAQSTVNYDTLEMGIQKQRRQDCMGGWSVKCLQL